MTTDPPESGATTSARLPLLRTIEDFTVWYCHELSKISIIENNARLRGGFWPRGADEPKPVGLAVIAANLSKVPGHDELVEEATATLRTILQNDRSVSKTESVLNRIDLDQLIEPSINDIQPMIEKLAGCWGGTKADVVQYPSWILGQIVREYAGKAVSARSQENLIQLEQLGPNKVRRHGLATPDSNLYLTGWATRLRALLAEAREQASGVFKIVESSDEFLQFLAYNHPQAIPKSLHPEVRALGAKSRTMRALRAQAIDSVPSPIASEDLLALHDESWLRFGASLFWPLICGIKVQRPPTKSLKPPDILEFLAILMESISRKGAEIIRGEPPFAFKNACVRGKLHQLDSPMWEMRSSVARSRDGIWLRFCSAEAKKRPN